MNPSLKHLLTIVVVCSLTFFLNLGEPRLWDRDEPRNAGCAAEMLAANNWVVPIFNDELRQQKPVLLYWLMMSAYSVFGVNEFSARFWSALLGVGTCLMTYAIGRRLFDVTIGWLAAIMLATNLMFCVAARAATPDSVLIFCCTMAYWFYVRGVFQGEQVVDGAFPAKARNWVPFYLTLGLAVLAKGPIGFLIPMAVVGMFMLIERSPKEPVVGLWSNGRRWIGYFWPVHFLSTLWAMRIFAGVAITLLVAMPWYLVVHLQTDGEFTRRFFLTENFARATSVMESHSGGVLFYPVAILAGFFPWSVFAGPTVVFLWSRSSMTSKQQSAITFLIGWVAIQVIAFSLFSTKLASYVTPCYPVLAILTAFGLVEFARTQADSPARVRWHMAAMIALLISGIGITVGLWLGMQRYLPNLKWLACIGMVPIVGSIFGWFLLRRSNRPQLIGAMAVCAVVFCVLLFGFGAKAVSDKRDADRIFERIAQHPGSVVGAWKCMEPSWVVYGKRSIYELTERDGFEFLTPEAVRQRTYMIGLKEWWGFKRRPIVHDFATKFPDALIITTDEHVDSLTDELPKPYVTLESVDLFLKPRRKLILLGPAE